MEASDREDMAQGDEAPPGEPSSGANVCPHCHGEGKHENGSECPVCGGAGEVNEAIGGG